MKIIWTALCSPSPAALPAFELLAIANLQEEKVTEDYTIVRSSKQ
jgi:hypothetical protein